MSRIPSGRWSNGRANDHYVQLITCHSLCGYNVYGASKSGYPVEVHSKKWGVKSDSKRVKFDSPPGVPSVEDPKESKQLRGWSQTSNTPKGVRLRLQKSQIATPKESEFDA